MNAAQPGCIRGRIHAPGPCVVQIRWYAVDGRCLGRKRSYAGTWSLRLPAGRYFVEVTDERPESDPTRFTSNTTAVVVRSGYVSELDQRLTRETRRSAAGRAVETAAPTGVLQGRVVDGADAATPLAGAQVRLLDADGRLVGRTRTGAGGHFAFEALTTMSDLQLVVRPAPASNDHLRLHRGGLDVTDGSWHDLGDLALPRNAGPRRTRRTRPAAVDFGSATALTLPAMRV
ncbi:MAG TPA: carboxypeptidase-like regulatory domain-containing protein [Nocardioides sp.]|uniref:MSCRAMM family protein n=1 Tax=Nocardioides sp. TaxID=35761 RepID=UPI002BB12211|nr:carboxypeptidase-like regulatory domain-containing protein [Nocardioides sp.]HTW17140.1 carboxypeptidase-like regulatory domain-containing protein [Nocardioides sp.]